MNPNPIKINVVVHESATRIYISFINSYSEEVCRNNHENLIWAILEKHITIIHIE